MKINIKKPKLTDYQKDILYNNSRFSVTAASTKCGKTFSHIWWLFEAAHNTNPIDSYLQPAKEGNNYWWVAPVYSQSEIAFGRMSRKVAKTGQYDINRSNLKITTPLGTNIHFKTAKDPDNLYGEDVYAAVYDEYTRGSAESWYALRSTLTATNAPCKLIGNFVGMGNWGYQLKLKHKEDPEYSFHRITAWDAVRAGILDEKEILQAQKDLPPKVFAALYLAESIEADDQLIQNEAITGLFSAQKATTYHGGKYITADIALEGSDLFVVYVWDGFDIIDFKILEKSAGPEVISTIQSIALKHGVPNWRIVFDSDGTGNFVGGFLSQSQKFRNGGPPVFTQTPYGEMVKEDYANLKSQCSFKAARLINSGLISISCDLGDYRGKLMQEMETVCNMSINTDNKLRVSDKKKVYEMIGRSCDLWDAIMMRMYFVVHSHLSDQMDNLYYQGKV